MCAKRSGHRGLDGGVSEIREGVGETKEKPPSNNGGVSCIQPVATRRLTKCLSRQCIKYTFLRVLSTVLWGFFNLGKSDDE
jgi:hypothetical protein